MLDLWQWFIFTFVLQQNKVTSERPSDAGVREKQINRDPQNSTIPSSRPLPWCKQMTQSRGSWEITFPRHLTPGGTNQNLLSHWLWERGDSDEKQTTQSTSSSSVGKMCYNYTTRLPVNKKCTTQQAKNYTKDIQKRLCLTAKRIHLRLYCDDTSHLNIMIFLMI